MNGYFPCRYEGEGAASALAEPSNKKNYLSLSLQHSRSRRTGAKEKLLAFWFKKSGKLVFRTLHIPKQLASIINNILLNHIVNIYFLPPLPSHIPFGDWTLIMLAHKPTCIVPGSMTGLWTKSFSSFGIK